MGFLDYEKKKKKSMKRERPDSFPVEKEEGGKNAVVRRITLDDLSSRWSEMLETIGPSYAETSEWLIEHGYGGRQSSS